MPDLSSSGTAPRPGSCLALHGLGGGTYEFGELLDILRAAGLEVLAPTLPGHDGPGPEMPPSCWRDWLETAQTAFDRLAARGQPVAVLGFSTGATLGLELARLRPVSRLSLLAPFLAIRYSGWIPVRPASYLQQLAKLLPDIPRRPPAVRDPEMRKWAAQQSRFTTFSLPAALSALELIDHVRPHVSEIEPDVLILQGRLDTVVEPRDSAWLLRHLGAQSKQLVWLERSDHLIGLDRDRAVAGQLVKDFLGPFPPTSAHGI